MDELKALLTRVPDSYEDFVIALMDEAKKSEKVARELPLFLKDNPNTISSDVLMYVLVDLGLYEEYRSNQIASVQTAIL